MHIPRVVCAIDGLEMVIHKTGEQVEMRSKGEPYYIVSGDTFRCPNCGHLVTLLATQAIAENVDPDYDKVAAFKTRAADLHG